MSVVMSSWLFQTNGVFAYILFIQSNLNSSNTDDSFTMANSKSFLSPYKSFPTAPENK